VIPRGKIAVAVHAVALAATASLATESRHPDCEPPPRPASHLALSADEARKIIADHFSQESAGEPLSFEGLTYACVTSSRSNDMREVAVFGRDDEGGLRLYIAGEAAAVRLQDAINRLIAEARARTAAPRVRPRAVKTPARPRPTPAPAGDAVEGVE
jgi:hypothetical protein